MVLLKCLPYFPSPRVPKKTKKQKIQKLCKLRVIPFTDIMLHICVEKKHGSKDKLYAAFSVLC